MLDYKTILIRKLISALKDELITISLIRNLPAYPQIILKKKGFSTRQTKSAKQTALTSANES